jgi:hypothetical protein
MEIHEAIMKLCCLSEEVGRYSEAINKMYEANKNGECYSKEEITKKEDEFDLIANKCNKLRNDIETACLCEGFCRVDIEE